MSDKIILRKGTKEEWELKNPVLGTGELGYEIDTSRLKVGNGYSEWSLLEYIDEFNLSGTPDPNDEFMSGLI